MPLIPASTPCGHWRASIHCVVATRAKSSTSRCGKSRSSSPASGRVAIAVAGVLDSNNPPPYDLRLLGRWISGSGSECDLAHIALGLRSNTPQARQGGRHATFQGRPSTTEPTSSRGRRKTASSSNYCRESSWIWRQSERHRFRQEGTAKRSSSGLFRVARGTQSLHRH